MKGRIIELTERTVSPQNQQITKVIVFNNFNANGNLPQVAAYRVYDSSNKLICQATIDRVQRDPASGVSVPQKILLEWPVQKLKLRLTLDGIQVNNPETDVARNSRLFTRPAIDNVRSFDLARGNYDAPPTSLRRMSGGVR